MRPKMQRTCAMIPAVTISSALSSIFPAFKLVDRLQRGVPALLVLRFPSPLLGPLGLIFFALADSSAR